MAETVTLEQVETLAAQLPPAQQLRLVAHIGTRLNATAPAATFLADDTKSRQQQEKEADELLAQLDAAASLWEGEFDAVEDIRQMRAEADKISSSEVKSWMRKP